MRAWILWYSLSASLTLIAVVQIIAQPDSGFNREVRGRASACNVRSDANRVQSNDNLADALWFYHLIILPGVLAILLSSVSVEDRIQ